MNLIHDLKTFFQELPSKKPKMEKAFSPSKRSLSMLGMEMDDADGNDADDLNGGDGYSGGGDASI